MRHMTCDICNIWLFLYHRKFRNHPSILKIKENVNVNQLSHFSPIDDTAVNNKTSSLNDSKPNTYNNIPTRVLGENKDIFSPFITKMYNVSKSNSNFKNRLKLADVTPVHKKEGRTTKCSYRPSDYFIFYIYIYKIFEKCMFEQIYSYIDKYLSPFLCGFRKGCSTQ